MGKNTERTDFLKKTLFERWYFKISLPLIKERSANDGFSEN